MSEDTYKTIVAPSEGIYTEKRSKFIAIALPVRTVEEVKAHLETYQKKYYDARHVCYAYMLGHERKDFRANDNGEPSGTAGKPILGQINSNELTDILIIVVRYFGGIKLGTSGLIEIMPLMFIPAGVGLIDSWGELRPILLPVIVLLLVSTVLVMGVSGQITQQMMHHGKKEDKNE